MSGPTTPKFEGTDDWLDKKMTLPTGFRWFRGEARSERAIARIKKKEAYEAEIAKKRANGEVR